MVNQKYEKIIKLMIKYDASELGSKEREELGIQLDKEGTKFNEKDKIKIEIEYKENKNEYTS